MSARDPGSAAVIPVQLQELDCLSSVRIYIPKDLRPPDARQLALKVEPSPCCPSSIDVAVGYGWTVAMSEPHCPENVTAAGHVEACTRAFALLAAFHELPHGLNFMETAHAVNVKVHNLPGPVQAVAEVQRRYPEGLPLLSPEEDMSVKDSAFRKAQRSAFPQESLTQWILP